MVVGTIRFVQSGEVECYHSVNDFGSAMEEYIGYMGLNAIRCTGHTQEARQAMQVVLANEFGVDLLTAE